jgi:hypothetical protein
VTRALVSQSRSSFCASRASLTSIPHDSANLRILSAFFMESSKIVS